MRSNVYLGTEIDEKWWRRYSKDGFLARGNGEYWIDASAFLFRRYLTDAPLVIPLGDVICVKLGTWHSGRWAYQSVEKPPIAASPQKVQTLTYE